MHPTRFSDSPTSMPDRGPARRWAILAMVASLTMLLAIGVCGPALAATSARDVGRNLGGLLQDWATWLFTGATAMIAVTHLGRRDVAGGAVFAGMAVLVGGFVLAGPVMVTLIESIYRWVATGR